MKIGLTSPILTYNLLHPFPYQSLPILTYFFSAVQQIHVPPPWPITDTHFYMGNHFSVFPVGFKHLGVHQHCQVSVAGNLLCKLASFTPHTEDPQDLNQQDASPGLQPSLFMGI